MTTPAANGFRTILDFDVEGPPIVTGIAIVVDYDDVALINGLKRANPRVDRDRFRDAVLAP